MLEKPRLHTHGSIPHDLTILYEDNHLIVVNKPAGILIQGDSSGQISLMDLVKDYIKQRYQKPGNVFLGLVHRLDRPVGGVTLFAKTSKAAARISEQWRLRQVAKIYWAQVHRRLDPPQGTLTAYLQKDVKGTKLSHAMEKGARQAILSYHTLKVQKERSLVEIKLQTGRKHQIRIQLAAAGCPIVGDLKYGAPFALPDRSIRLMAKILMFNHPTRQEALTIEAPAPEWD